MRGKIMRIILLAFFIFGLSLVGYGAIQYHKASLGMLNSNQSLSDIRKEGAESSLYLSRLTHPDGFSPKDMEEVRIDANKMIDGRIKALLAMNKQNSLIMIVIGAIVFIGSVSLKAFFWRDIF